LQVSENHSVPSITETWFSKLEKEPEGVVHFSFSHDRKFIIKTMTQSELDLYLKKLPAFCEHFQKNKNSLLAKIFGVFTVNTEHMKEVHVMLMENTA